MQRVGFTADSWSGGSKEGERRRESGGKDVEEKQKIQESRGSRREVQIPASDREYRSDRDSTYQYRAVGMVLCRRPWRVVEDEWVDDTGGDCVEESREIPESREVSGGSQSLSRVRPAKTDTSNPPNQVVEGGTRDPRVVGLRDRDRAAKPEQEERERETAERETQSERHRAPAQVNEGGEVCCGINQPS